MDIKDIAAIITVILQFLVFPIAVYALGQFRKMRESVEILNIQIAVVISRLDTHDHRISRIEEKL